MRCGRGRVAINRRVAADVSAGALYAAAARATAAAKAMPRVPSFVKGTRAPWRKGKAKQPQAKVVLRRKKGKAKASKATASKLKAAKAKLKTAKAKAVAKAKAFAMAKSARAATQQAFEAAVEDCLPPTRVASPGPPGLCDSDTDDDWDSKLFKAGEGDDKSNASYSAGSPDYDSDCSSMCNDDPYMCDDEDFDEGQEWLPDMSLDADLRDLVRKMISALSTNHYNVLIANWRRLAKVQKRLGAVGRRLSLASGCSGSGMDAHGMRLVCNVMNDITGLSVHFENRPASKL